MLHETPRLSVHRARKDDINPLLSIVAGHPEVSYVNAAAMPANAASIRVLEKCGLRFVKYVPQANRNLYRITRPEWTELSGS